MKKVYYLLLCFLLVNAGYVTGQINGDFNSAWVTDTKGNGALPGQYLRPGTQPYGWEASNVNQTVFFQTKTEIVVTPDADRTGGSGFSAKMENKFIGISSIGSNVPAYLTLGVPWAYAVIKLEDCTGGTVGGVPYTQRPDSIVGYFKRTIGGEKSEDALILAYLWRGTSVSAVPVNPTGNFISKDTAEVYDQDICVLNSANGATLIGKAEYRISGNLDEWTRIAIPFVYNSSGTPEKLNIIISSANYYDRSAIGAGNILWADDVELVFKRVYAETILAMPTLYGECYYGKDADFYPYSNNTDSPFDITVEDPSIVSIENGRIKFLKPGTTNITVSQEATTYFSAAEKTMTVTVVPAPLTVGLNELALEYGQTPANLFEYDGLSPEDTNTILHYPEYVFDQIPIAEVYTTSGEKVTFPAPAGNYVLRWTQEPLSENYTITVDRTEKRLKVKEKNPEDFYRVNIPEVEGATINLAWGENEIRKDEPLILTITAVENYSLENMTVMMNDSLIYPIEGIAPEKEFVTLIIGIQQEDFTIRIEGIKSNSSTGISEIKDNISIYTQPGHLYISAEKESELAIYNITGEQVIRRNIAYGTTAIPLNRGIYIVKVDNKVQKVSVK